MSLVGYVGVSEAARELGLSVSQVRNLWKQGKLVGMATPYGRAITVASLEAEKQRRASLAREDS